LSISSSFRILSRAVEPSVDGKNLKPGERREPPCA
jgi:hypothetical protein